MRLLSYRVDGLTVMAASWEDARRIARGDEDSAPDTIPETRRSVVDWTSRPLVHDAVN